MADFYELEPQPRSPFEERSFELYGDFIPYVLNIIDTNYPVEPQLIVPQSPEVTAYESSLLNNDVPVMVPPSEEVRSYQDRVEAESRYTETPVPTSETAFERGSSVSGAPVSEQSAPASQTTLLQDEDRQAGIEAARAKALEARNNAQWN